MNRPQKNKIKNPTLPEDQQVDERNLIDVEESEEISFEDRIHMYWMENKAFVSGCIGLLALVIVGFNGMRMYVSYAESSIQNAYTEAMANDALEVFAKKYSKKPLGGLAALDAADVFYNQENYESAAEYYSLAAEALDNSLLSGRALLGLAFATFYAGKEEAALEQLSAVAENSDLAESIRAEAAYHLAVHADVAGDTEAFDSYATQVISNPLSGQWNQRMQMYQQQR